MKMAGQKCEAGTRALARSAAAAIAGLIGLSLLAASPAARAQTQQQIDWCNGKDGATADQQISGCTAFIRSGNYSGKNLAMAYNNRAAAWLNKGDYERLIADADRAIELDPNLALAYNNRAGAWINKQDYERAIADCDQAIRLNPNLAIAYNNRAAAWVGKGDYERVIADADRAIKLDPNHALAYYNRGVASYNKKDYDRAIADFDQAIRLNPQHQRAYAGRGYAWREKGDRERALADLRKAADLGDSVAKQEMEKLLASAPADQQANVRPSTNNSAPQQRSERTASAAPTNGELSKFYFLRGLSSFNARNFDNAISEATNSLKFAPADAGALMLRSNAYSEKGQFSDAIADLDRLLEADPSDAIAYYFRGKAYLAMGDTRHAEMSFTQAARLGDEKAKQELSKLKQRPESNPQNGSDYCATVKITMNSKISDWNKRCPVGVELPIARADSCEASKRVIIAERNKVHERCPQLPLVGAGD